MMTDEERQIALEERRRYQRERMARIRREEPDRYRDMQLQVYYNRAMRRKAHEERQRLIDEMEKSTSKKK